VPFVRHARLGVKRNLLLFTTVATSPTYWQDVEPIFAINCASCHTDGGIGPFPIDDPDSAIENASRIAIETSAHRMPPWPSGGDTPALLHTRSLTQAQIDQAQIDAIKHGPTPGRRWAIRPSRSREIGIDYVSDTSLTDDYRCSSPTSA